LGASAKSSGFRLRTLAARQFGLMTKQGDMLRNTPLAKAIIKPTNETERDNAIVESFHSIPLFKAIATRFKGQPLPQGEAFHNILEREFRIQNNRVSEAERIFRDSAREAGLLQTSGSNTYLAAQTTLAGQSIAPSQTSTQAPIQPASAPAQYPIQQSASLVPMGNSFTISEQDLDDMSDDDFNEIWEALGKVIRARGRKRGTPAKEEQTEIEEEKSENENK